MENGEKIHILYLEDDIGLARLLVKNMERSGIIADLANNGKIGLQMIAENQYDVIVTDQQMPEMSGLEVIEALSHFADTPPIIMLTGAGNEKIAVDAMKLGASDYIIKDVDGVYLNLLPSAIKQVIHQQRLIRERKQALADLEESEERYRTLFNSSHDAILIFSPQGQFLDGNPAALNLFGCKNEQEFLKLTLELVSPDYQPDGFLSFTRIREFIEVAIKEGSTFFEWSHRSLNGQIFPALVSLNVTNLRGSKVLQANIREISKQKLTEQILHKQATEDPLTECFNRRHFFSLAVKEVARSESENLTLSVIMFDFDLFKIINDTYGHNVGDIVLVEQTRRIRNILRPSDIFARYGGEEFVILLPQTSLENAKSTAERIRRHVAEPIQANEIELISTISFGVATKESHENISIDKVLDRADQALYKAKNNGRNSVCAWDDCLKPGPKN